MLHITGYHQHYPPTGLRQCQQASTSNAAGFARQSLSATAHTHTHPGYAPPAAKLSPVEQLTPSNTPWEFKFTLANSNYNLVEDGNQHRQLNPLLCNVLMFYQRETGHSFMNHNPACAYLQDSNKSNKRYVVIPSTRQGELPLYLKIRGSNNQYTVKIANKVPKQNAGSQRHQNKNPFRNLSATPPEAVELMCYGAIFATVMGIVFGR